MDTANFFHSVTLDRDKCHGCINCVKRCPTEAIRVRGGKAKIIKERCIDCGECIRVCPHHAKQAIFDPLSVMDRCPRPRSMGSSTTLTISISFSARCC